MADNTTINAGTGGDVIATDDIGGGVKVQRVKATFGVDGTATDVSATDPLPVAAARPGTGAVTSVAAATSSTTLLAANTARKAFSVFNDSAAILYVKLATAASASSYTVRVAPGGFWEPEHAYTGLVTGIWSAADGNARVTELT